MNFQLGQKDSYHLSPLWNHTSQSFPQLQGLKRDWAAYWRKTQNEEGEGPRPAKEERIKELQHRNSDFWTLEACTVIHAIHCMIASRCSGGGLLPIHSVTITC